MLVRFLNHRQGVYCSSCNACYVQRITAWLLADGPAVVLDISPRPDNVSVGTNVEAVARKVEDTVTGSEHVSSKEDVLDENMAALHGCSSVAVTMLESSAAALLIGKGLAVQVTEVSLSVSSQLVNDTPTLIAGLLNFTGGNDGGTSSCHARLCSSSAINALPMFPISFIRSSQRKIELAQMHLLIVLIQSSDYHIVDVLVWLHTPGHRTLEKQLLTVLLLPVVL